MEAALAPFSYDLPDERIAQRPVYPYDSAKMLVVARAGGMISESRFAEIDAFLSEKDLLVFNDTKVIPARFLGRIAATNAECEVLLLEERDAGVWACLGKPLKKLKSGSAIIFGSKIRAEVLERISDFEIVLKFDQNVSKEEIFNAGVMPIPPYIRAGLADAKDSADYQSIFARHEGSVAAPTASLHFTPALLQKLKSKGVRFEYLTLHLGKASFLPVIRPGEITPTPPSAEKLSVNPELSSAISQTREQGGRVVAVGTSAVRALESIEEAEQGTTSLFIRPPYRFKNTDAMVTNFHQPGTTHLLLVEAFLGRELLAKSYDLALASDYRFLSYGDGMLLL